jgi:2-(1,2-epoxy-1,2-dihydrophenyl)acetyl-CoA isomerase
MYGRLPMSEPSVVFERSGPVAEITLNRPAQGNAIDMSVARALLAAALQCDTDASIRCVVLTGRGRLFCAGGDLGLFNDAGHEISAVVSELAATLHAALTRLARMQKPLLTLVNGAAAGAGLSLAMVGDVVLAARSAHFTCAYSSVGLTPDGGMTWMLPRLVGVRKAQEMLLTNCRVEAREAERIGLITRVVDDDSLAEEGADIAARLARSATRALGVTRSLLLQSFDSAFEAQLEREARAIAAAAATGESAEGIAAFVSKRPAVFGGD